MDSQANNSKKFAPNKRRRLNNRMGGSGHDDIGGEDDVISLYSDSSNDGGNVSSNASSSPESAKMANTINLTGPQQTSMQSSRSEEATKYDEVRPSKLSSRGAADDDTDKEEYCTTYRTVQVPRGVTEGDLFHVLILSDGAADKVIGVTCPNGVKGGDTIIIVEPGSPPPLSPDQIAKINQRRLMQGIDKDIAKWVVISFWKIVWPKLVEDGWLCKRESLYNFGSVTFCSPAAKQMTTREHKLNQEYFETISAVLDYIKLISTRMALLVDMCFADAEKRKMKCAQLATNMANSPKKRSYSAHDRWKYPTGMEALKHSRVGNPYQAHCLPDVGTYSKGDNCCTLEPIGDLKEYDRVNSTWRDWAKDDAFANEFHCKILEVKKQFRLLAASINKPIGFCLWYYYYKYKTSDNYFTLKKLLMDNNESGENSDECVICDDGGGESGA